MCSFFFFSFLFNFENISFKGISFFGEFSNIYYDYSIKCTRDRVSVCVRSLFGCNADVWSALKRMQVSASTNFFSYAADVFVTRTESAILHANVGDVRAVRFRIHSFGVTLFLGRALFCFPIEDDFMHNNRSTTTAWHFECRNSEFTVHHIHCDWITFT